ncbi:MAG: nucleotidyltransferase family protein [Bacteroidales bacterium]|nr:nucleotidyltransferase family protein [Bacteroidales bacterium]
MINEAVILAGGLGTRLRTVVKEIPKSMAPVNGKPFLEYQLAYVKRFGIERIIFSVGYLRDSIIQYFGDHFKRFNIAYAIEQEPLGTGGGICNALKHVNGDEALVLNGDTMFDVDLRAMADQHHQNKADLTLALKEVDDVSRYGAVYIDDENQIIGFSEKNTETGKGLINGGIYIIKKDIFTRMGLSGKFSMEKDVFEKHLHNLDIYGFASKAYFLDIGVPEDYERAQKEFKRFNG